jgi:hypothetical protein
MGGAKTLGRTTPAEASAKDVSPRPVQTTGGGQVGKTPLAKRAGNVFESVTETSDMNNAHAYWFHFYSFPQPPAEGLI